MGIHSDISQGGHNASRAERSKKHSRIVMPDPLWRSGVKIRLLRGDTDDGQSQSCKGIVAGLGSQGLALLLCTCEVIARC